MANYDQKGQNTHTQINADTVNIHLNSNGSSNQQSKSTITKEIEGTWVSGNLRMQIFFIDGSPKIESWVDTTKHKVTNISWNGRELKATFQIPNGKFPSHSIIKQISPNELEDTYTYKELFWEVTKKIIWARG